MALPSSVLQRGTRAAQPAASATAAGTIYYVTDELVTERSTGAAWQDISDGGTTTVAGPASATDNAIARFDGTTGRLIQNSAVTIADTTGVTTGMVFPNTGLNVQDTNASHNLNIKPGSDITANRTLTLTTGDADRTLTLSGNASLNQDVLTTSDPSFNTVKINDSDDSHTVQVLMGSNITANRTLTVTTGDADRTLTLPVIGVVGITIDGGGSAITAGVKGYIECPYAGTIVAATLLADQSGSIVIDVWKDTYANYPPTVADTITASAKPTLSSATKSQDTTLTGWTTSVSAGDIFGFNVDALATNVTRVHLILKINRS